MARRKTTDLEPGVWHEVAPTRIKEWRKVLPKGAVREVSTGRRDLPTVDLVDADTGSVSAAPRRTWVEPREAIEIHVADFLADLQKLKAASDTAYLDRIRKLRQMAGWDHLTDEQAADQILVLAEKVAQIVTEPVYQKKGLRPQDFDRVAAGRHTGAVLLPGQGGR